MEMEAGTQTVKVFLGNVTPLVMDWWSIKEFSLFMLDRRLLLHLSLPHFPSSLFRDLRVNTFRSNYEDQIL